MTILGGDQRSLALAKLFADEGRNVFVYGFDSDQITENVKQAESLEDAIKDTKIIIGPLPFTRKHDRIHTPLFKDEIFLKDVFNHMHQDAYFFAGSMAKEVEQVAKDYHVKMIDYFKEEGLQVCNAIPTAEGAIQIALEKMDITLHGAKVLVLGFGRIGKTLAHRLDGLGADVTVSARKHADIAWIQSYGYEAVNVSNLATKLPHMHCIINTVPTMLLDTEELEDVQQDCLIIDVASKPGGVNFTEAERLGIEKVWALGLPGIVAPKSAAMCMKQTIVHLIDNLEV